MAETELQVIKINCSDTLKRLTSVDLDACSKRNLFFNVLVDVDAFLTEADVQRNLGKIVGQCAELSQLLCLISRDSIVLTSPEMYQILIRILLRFHFPNATDPLKVKSTHWSQTLIRSTLVFPEKAIQASFPGFQYEHHQFPVQRIIEVFQEVLVDYLASGCRETEMLRQLTIDGLLLLNCGRLNPDLLLHLIKNLPHRDMFTDGTTLCEAVAENLRQDLNIYSLELKKELAKKYPSYLSKSILSSFHDWIRNKNSGLGLPSWLVEGAAHDKHLFAQIFRALFSLYAQVENHLKVVKFTQATLADITKVRQSSRIFLYPDRWMPLVLLLDVHPEGFTHQMIESHCIKILGALNSALAAQTVRTSEVLVLMHHFPDWWSQIRDLERNSASEQVRFELQLFKYLSSPPSV